MKKFVITVTLIFSIWTFGVDVLENIMNRSIDGLSTVGMYGSQSGYTIVNFILLYIVGAYISKGQLEISQKKSLCVIFMLLSSIYVLSIVEPKLGLPHITTWKYNNPLLIMLAAFLTIFSTQINIRNRIINELAGATFTCFLFHGVFLAYMKIPEAVQSSLLKLIVHQFTVGIGLFLLSYIVHKVYTFCIHWFIELITPLCNKIDITIESKN